MNTSSLKIASLTIGAGGALVGTGFAAQNYLNGTSKKEKQNAIEKIKSPEKQSIIDLLKSENLELIKTGDDKATFWTPRWTKFKRDHTKAPEGDWKINSWANADNDDTKFEEFKKLCETNGAKKIQNKTENIYTKVKDYCTKTLTQPANE